VKRAAIALVLVLAGCAQQDLTLVSEADLPSDVYGPPRPTPSQPAIPANGRIFFVTRARLEPMTLDLQPVLDSVPEALLVALFQGPQRDISTEVPEGTRLNGVQVAGGIATIDVSGDFERAAPPRSQALRIAQVVYTLTDPKNETGIQGVRFQIDGVPQEAIGGEQLGTIPGPVTRADYERFAPRERDRPSP
jgi:hypothetical protein